MNTPQGNCNIAPSKKDRGEISAKLAFFYKNAEELSNIACDIEETIARITGPTPEDTDDNTKAYFNSEGILNDLAGLGSKYDALLSRFTLLSSQLQNLI